jgi:hypothetical protein
MPESSFNYEANGQVFESMLKKMERACLLGVRRIFRSTKRKRFSVRRTSKNSATTSRTLACPQFRNFTSRRIRIAGWSTTVLRVLGRCKR